MKRARGANVCPRCGQTGSVTLEDGSEAEFERGGPPAAPRVWIIAGLVLLIAGLGAVGWWRRDELLSLLPGTQPVPVVAAFEAPDWRLARRDEFAEPLRAGLIGVFGTRAGDQPAAFAALGSGELVTVLAASEGEGRARPAILRLSGGAAFQTIPLDAPEGLIGASLAAGGVTGFYLALTEPSGVRLLAYQDAMAPVWERRAARSAPPLRKAKVVAADGQVYLAGPAESAGRLSVAAYAEDGALVWQRSFEAPEEARLFVSPLRGGGLFLAFETAVSEAGSEVLALWLTEGGETAGVLAGLRLEGRLAGARAQAGRALLLIEGAAVTLRAVDADGQTAWQALVPEAELHEALYLEEMAADQMAVVSAYRLSDLQTDVTVNRIAADGSALAAIRFRLPPGVLTGDLAATGRSGFILSGRLGEGEDADAFLLALDWDGAPEAAGAAGAVNRPPADSVDAPASPDGPAAGTGRPVPAQSDTPGSQARAATPEPETRACRFTCQDGETVFPLSRTLDEAEAGDAARLEVVHGEACGMLGAEPAAGAAPVCGP